MGIKLKSIAGKFAEVAKSVSNPILLMVMGYISNLLILIYNQGDTNSVTMRVLRVMAFAVREFEVELKQIVTASDTPYDDVLVDELIEVVDEILGDPGKLLDVGE